MAKMMLNDDADFHKRLREEGAYWMRHLVEETVQSLMSADADAKCGAGYGERNDERNNSRNGYRSRAWDCQAESIGLQVPKLLSGSYFPHWLLEPRRRVARALHQVVAECYVTGVSTRRVDRLVQTLGIDGIDGIDKSQVSRSAKDLDTKGEEFRNWPFTGSPYRYVWIDALYIKAREGGRTVSVAVGIASAVNHDEKREIIGLDTFTSETGAAWTAFHARLSRVACTVCSSSSATVTRASKTPSRHVYREPAGNAAAPTSCEIFWVMRQKRATIWSQRSCARSSRKTTPTQRRANSRQLSRNWNESRSA